MNRRRVCDVWFIAIAASFLLAPAEAQIAVRRSDVVELKATESNEWVAGAVLSDKEDVVLLLTADNRLERWSISTGKAERRFSQAVGTSSKCRMSAAPDATYVIVLDDVATLYDGTDGKQIVEIPSAWPPSAASILRTGKTVVLGQRKTGFYEILAPLPDTVRLWQLTELQRLSKDQDALQNEVLLTHFGRGRGRLGINGNISAVALSPEENTVVFGTEQRHAGDEVEDSLTGTMAILDATLKKVRKTIPLEGALDAYGLSPSGQYFGGGTLRRGIEEDALKGERFTYDRRIHVWNIKKDCAPLDFDVDVPRVTAVYFALMGKVEYLLTGHDDGSIKLWSLGEKRLLWEEIAQASAVCALVVRAVGEQSELTAVSTRGQVVRWRINH